MSTVQTLVISTTSSEATLELGAKVGHRLRGGETICLSSDLGGGKTAFVRGLSRGAGSKDGVSSPSFTISNEYKSPNFTVHHFDFYRLPEPGLMTASLSEFLNQPDAVVVIEWAQIIESILPNDSIQIFINPKGETEREFQFTYPVDKAYLFEELRS